MGSAVKHIEQRLLPVVFFQKHPAPGDHIHRAPGVALPEQLFAAGDLQRLGSRQNSANFGIREPLKCG